MIRRGQALECREVVIALAAFITLRTHESWRSCCNGRVDVCLMKGLKGRGNRNAELR